MVSMKHALTCLLMSLPTATSCPFKKAAISLSPNDAVHQPSNLRGRRLSEFMERRANQRALSGECFSDEMYDAIHADVVDIAEHVTDIVERAHFFGGIVRLAAHDFMDFDPTASPTMGADGCFDVTADDNKGLDTIWCDTCPLTVLYNGFYSHISKADFWIAAANAVIKHTSPNNDLDLKSTFQWGRIDAASCAGSAALLPGSSACSEVERVFLGRLGMSYTDAVALIGAHTLGRGNRDFSGHHGIWDVDEQNSMRFDNGYFRELVNRPWVPRNDNPNAVLPQDWTWGGLNSPNAIGDSPRFALNTDLCLVFDVETTFPCCTNNNTIRNNGVNACDGGGRDLSNTLCGAYPAGHDRTEAADAVRLFAGGNNSPFFNAFAIAWEKATKNGWGTLQDLKGTCEETLSPIKSPTINPTSTPTAKPTTNPTMTPTENPSTSEACRDFDDQVFNNNNQPRDCAWVIAGERCRSHADVCPKSCNGCACRIRSWICESGEECCSRICNVDGECDCKGRDAPCGADVECCSGNCRDNGTCGGSGGGGGGLFP